MYARFEVLPEQVVVTAAGEGGDGQRHGRAPEWLPLPMVVPRVTLALARPNVLRCATAAVPPRRRLHRHL